MDGQLVVIGNFDGVHRGHQAVLRGAEALAASRSLGAVLLTFEPHPARVLGRTPPATLTTLARKIELVRRIAPEVRPVILPFDATFAAQSPREFAERVLASELGAKVVVVGKNFRFGKSRAGDFDTLASLGVDLGFDTTSHELLSDESGVLSSSRVRDAIAAGDVALAGRILGRPHMISGVVVHGDRRGRTIGFPTVNLGGVAEAIPRNGVYAVLVDRVVEGAPRALARGVANVGVRPTVAAGALQLRIEAHLFDFDEDVYDAELRVHFVDRLRDERAFSGLEALKAQIEIDASEARALVAGAVLQAPPAWA